MASIVFSTSGSSSWWITRHHRHAPHLQADRRYRCLLPSDVPRQADLSKLPGVGLVGGDVGDVAPATYPYHPTGIFPAAHSSLTIGEGPHLWGPSCVWCVAISQFQSTSQ